MARGRTRDAQHLLVLLVWLKSFQRLGYFPKLVDVPEVVAAHLCGVLELPAGTVLVQDAERTAKRHRQWVRDRLGVTYERRGSGTSQSGRFATRCRRRTTPRI